jgi:tetratricopeptide (TPR) repeat protein
MIVDAFGLSTSSHDRAATTAFEEAVQGLAAHKPHTGVALGRTLAADPSHVPAIVLKGFANLILAREELQAGAIAAAREARLALAAGGTVDEHALADALDLAVAGHFDRAADRLDTGFAARPATFLPFKIAYSLRFMRGDTAGLLAMSGRMMDAWREDLPAAGYLLGCRAFALEEDGQFAAAERAGRRAVALQPDDAWGMHAVSHVHEMRGEAAEGIDWLEATRPAWSRCNNFSFHMAWHLALLHLERGEHDRVLALYDAEVRPVQSDDFRDVANAVSLLWRLNCLGVDVGTRWVDLREVAERRQDDVTLVFAALHTLFTLVALDDHRGVASLLAALEAKAMEAGDQASTAAQVGVPLARLIARGEAEDWDDIDPLLAALPEIGGSQAQRDLFLLAIADAATRRGDRASLAKVEIIRSRLKAEDRLIRAIDSRAEAATRFSARAGMARRRVLPSFPAERTCRPSPHPNSTFAGRAMPGERFSSALRKEA